MSQPTWNGGDSLPDWSRIGWAGRMRIVMRVVPIALLIGLGLLVMLPLRLVERAFAGQGRPVTPVITRIVCRLSLMVLGLRLRTHGTPMRERGAVVANHVGWIDILTLNAAQQIYFVSKDDVATWPGIGYLARVTGTLFIERRSAQALEQKSLFETRLGAGHKLMFFPEGTSTDGLRVLPFKSTLFAAFFSDALVDILSVQPVSVVYTAPRGADPRFYGWWGDMDFGPHLLQVLAAPRQGSVDITFHPPVRVADFASRKLLAQHCETAVRSAFDR